MSALRSSAKYQSPSSVKAYSPSKVSTKASGLGGNNASMMRSTGGKGGMKSTTEFSKHLRTLQQTADENIEDEYIKNLQQQIAYQELELKLLKEKELEQKASVSQIDKFFNDGVPLNENILALKNQYNHHKKTLENRIDDLNDLRQVELKVAVDLKNHYERNSANLKTINEALDKKEKEFVVHMADLRMAYLNEKHRREENEKEHKRLQIIWKEKNNENLQMTRDLERDTIMIHHRVEVLKNKRIKTIDDLKGKEKWLVSLTDEVEKKRGALTFNPEISMLENENLELNSKLISCEKQAHLAMAKVKEMDMFLETRYKEREMEAELKRDLMAKITQVQFWIEEQNKINEIKIQDKVKEKEDKEKRDLEKEIHEVQSLKTITKQRQEQKEDHVKEMLQERMGVQQDIMALEQENAAFEKEIKEHKETLVTLRNKKEALTQEHKDLEDKLQPIIQDNGKMREAIPVFEAENEKTKEQIAHMEKLNELSVQLKNVNLEELKLLTQSNDQVQNTITDLMRKWDFLQRMGGLKANP